MNPYAVETLSASRVREALARAEQHRHRRAVAASRPQPRRYLRRTRSR